METEQNKLENFQNSVLSVKSTVGGLIKNIINTSNAPILDVFNYSPPEYTSWQQTYQKIPYGSGRTHTQPLREFSEFQLELKQSNSLGVSQKSLGIYFINNDQFFYVGKTDRKIEQRFHAHITKITGTNNKKHHHPKNWQKYATNRYQSLASESVNLNDIRMSYFDFELFQSFLISGNQNDKLSEFESLIFYWINQNYSDVISLNSDAQIGKKPMKDWHRAMWKQNRP